MGSIALASLFHKAYGVDEILFLGDNLSPLFVEDAKNILNYYNLWGTQNTKNHNDKPIYQKLEDTTQLAPEYELAIEVNEQLEIHRTVLEYLCATLLARLLTRAHKAELLKNSGKKLSASRQKEIKPAHMVMQTIHESTPLMRQALEDMIYIMTIETDSLTGEMINSAPETLSPRQSLPNWMYTHKSWTEPMNNAVCKGLLELDAYSALLDWVDARGQTYLPIIAPAHLEANGNVRQGNNTNTDLILCDITSSKIIPIQVKKSVGMGAYSEYKKGMVFITPTTLGIVEPFNRTARRPNGHAYTAPSARTRYGHLSSEYFMNTNKNNREHVFAKSRQHLDDILGPLL